MYGQDVAWCTALRPGGLALAVAGILFLLAAFGVGHVYQNCSPPYRNCR